MTDSEKTGSGTTGDQPVNVEYEKNVPQEQVQSNEKWDTGTEKDPSEADKQEYWDQTTDENAEDGAGMATGGGGKS
ncbi:hypothetical protein [Deinococcus altitudinis]|uniref:hypothetical protein n=1 Tax=Deinococcus altitudinis TaxID=468914 RepID=UPI0038929AD3